ncbi:SDR family oxidoreductase [Sphingomonas jatrophae]|uniref:Short-chain dehydrogenase n=1 Tax=Sphingomonas jatrophae TaxID=1166337 RepID=A0A1I6KB59_9SPHN|nr:SDR family oxidoreductase [Sphingomonas jatrophae]SFR88459.1 Short-chain dehydrogenase [Sphingomonas jatrophae]
MKSVLITGASGGFGSDVALELARSGWHVFAGIRDIGKAAHLVERLVDHAPPGAIIPVVLDVTQQDSIDEAVASVLDATDGVLDALLNNAGYSVLGAFEDLDDTDCRAQMETNFFGTLAVTRAVLPAMRVAQRGRIVIVSSNAVNAPHPLLTMYAASKWALEGWAEGLAMELSPFGVEVVVVQPGAHRTPFANHVQFVQPTGSAYKKWLDAVLPSVADLDEWGRDPALATKPIVEAICNKGVRFRCAVGEDVQTFSALKSMAPYETRAFVVRSIINAPAPNAFTDKENLNTTERHVLEEIVARVAAYAADSRAGDIIAKTFGLR